MQEYLAHTFFFAKQFAISRILKSCLFRELFRGEASAKQFAKRIWGEGRGAVGAPDILSGGAAGAMQSNESGRRRRPNRQTVFTK